MSPRRVAFQRLGLGISLIALLLGGCIFSPTEKVNQGPPPIGIPESPPQLIQKLREAYQNRNYTDFENLFPTAEDNAPYLFILSAPLPTGQWNWDVTEELRIHRRMFQPENPLPGETPVRQDLWLVGITITLTATRDWVERPDLYASPGNPDGLDSAKWKAEECEYQADVLFDTQTDTDYRVNGPANFVVITDLTKEVGQDRKFLIYRWEDLGQTKPTAATAAVPAI